MKLSDFEVGHAIEYDKFGIRRGLVVDVTRLYIVVVQVFRVMKQLPDNCFYHVPCYDDIDDVNFVYDKHKDNIRLRKCPPPFVDFSDGINENVYAYAGKTYKFGQKEIDEYGVTILDGGAKVDDDVIAEVLHHPFPQQLQKQLTYQRSLPDDVSEQSDKDDGHGIE